MSEVDARDIFLRELDELRELLGGSFTGVPASGDQARRLSDGCRRSLEEGPEFSFELFEDTGPVPEVLGPVPPSGVVVREPESSALWRAQVEHVWSMPKVEGPGRSIKLEIGSKDHPGDVLGWLELASAPLVMKRRDTLFPSTSSNGRVDLRTVGAHPRFASWRGSSLVGMLGLTDAVLRLWEDKYGDPVELVQTTGAFGVSAVYERKRLEHGRRWRRIQMTSGTYPVLPDSIVEAAKKVTGRTRMRTLWHAGQHNMRVETFKAALSKVGITGHERRVICDSLGIQRAVYVSPATVRRDQDPQDEVDEAYDWWLRRYARDPLR